MREPLQELFDLYEQEMMPKQDPDPTVGGPADVPAQEPYEHPVATKKRMLDAEVQAGVDPTSAFEYVFGDVDPADVNKKAELAQTLGRYSKDKTGNVKPEEGSTSIFAIDAALEAMEDETETPEEKDQEMKTPSEYEEQPLDKMEEFDYNDDVRYLQTYGRA